MAFALPRGPARAQLDLTELLASRALLDTLARLAKLALQVARLVTMG